MRAEISPPHGDPQRRALDERVLTWMGENDWKRDDERFDALARELFAFQFEHCTPYGRFCRARGADPASVSNWREIPAVPTGAFKEARLISFPEERTIKVFRTSGTSTAVRGALHLDTLDLYEASLLPSIGRFVFPDIGAGQSIAMRILAPDPEEVGDSSLSHMFGTAVAALGSPGSGFEPRLEAPLSDELAAFFEQSRAVEHPIAICGTAFAFVHLMDAAREHGLGPFSLPPGSRIMETGGFKGRSREVARSELYLGLSQLLGIPESHIVNQYGMTELGSQFYDSTLFETLMTDAPGPRRKLGPPWTRVRIVDPETMAEVPAGEAGMVIIHDLANTGSIAAIETADLGRTLAADDARLEGGFEILGRAPGAETRGCSIAADALLESARANDHPDGPLDEKRHDE